MTAAAIILAAGASRRMGRNKMLLHVDGEALVRRAVRRALAAGADPVIVVTGHEPGLVHAELDGLACSFVHNPDFTGPTSTSLHCGLQAVPSNVDAAAVILADMPLVTNAMLRALFDALRDSNAPLAVSRYGDVFAPPLLFHRSLFAELLAWHGEGCGKQVVLRHQDEAAIIDWPVDALMDIDTPEDLLRIQ